MKSSRDGGRYGYYVRISVVLVALTVFTVLYLATNDQLGNLTSLPSLRHGDGEEDHRKYLVDGAHCKIPNTDPFDPSIQEYLSPTTPVVCSAMPPLTKIVRKSQRSHILVTDMEVTDRYKVIKKHKIICCYSIVTRVTQSLKSFNSEADHKYKVGYCTRFSKETALRNTTEFIYVRCQSVPKGSRTGRIVYENMHAIVPWKKPTYGERESDEEHEKLNVIIIGIDSVSRLSLRRTMPASLSHIRSNNWIEMNGYNKIADNTLPNLMAILAGSSMDDIHKDCLKETGNKTNIDDCYFIWNSFKERGFLTAYAEDLPSYATFNYRMTGFVNPPTDYYLRPFMLASHNLLPLKNKDGLPICIGPQSAADIIFDYALDFVNLQKESYDYETFFNQRGLLAAKTSPNKSGTPPLFGLFWLNTYSHNDVNSPAALDHRLLQFLTQLDAAGVYNNSIVLLLSDHGVRFGKIRNSFQGYLEERLPFLFIRYPSWYLQKHPTIRQNLLENRNRLVSPYDVHATLTQLFGKKLPPKSCTTCLPLTQKISKDRSCPEAGIDPHWCTCPEFKKIPATHPKAGEVSEFLMQRITNKTTDLMDKEKVDASLCLPRRLLKIVRVHMSSTNNYVVVIETEPHGVFEATIGANKNMDFEVLGFISRLDSYFSTSKCVQSKLLQFYCHCA